MGAVENGGGGIRQKVRTLLWFARRPRLYPELVVEVGETLRGARGGQDPVVRAWCAERVVGLDEVVERLTGAPPDGAFDEIHADAFAAARARVQRAKAAEGPDMPKAGAGDVGLAYWLTRRTDATAVVETGVAFGYSSLAFLLAMADRPDARLVSTDMPLQRTSGDHIGAAIPDELRDRWTLHLGLDRQVLESAVAGAAFDIAHYDSDKRYDGRMWGYDVLWRALRPGGFLISDDVADNAAFRDFSTRVGGEPTIVAYDDKYVGVLVKPSV